jgi:hypothetical protein
VFVLLLVILLILAAVFFLTGGTMQQLERDPLGAIRADASGIYHDPRGAMYTAEGNMGRMYTDARGRVHRWEERGMQYAHDSRDRMGQMYHDGSDRARGYYHDGMDKTRHFADGGKQWVQDHRGGGGLGDTPRSSSYHQDYAPGQGSGYPEPTTPQTGAVQPATTRRFGCC